MTYNDAYFSFNETTLPHSGPTAAPGVVEPLAGIIGPLPIRGGSKEGSEISGPPVAPKKVQDKAVTCQNFQKACSSLVVILMLSCFVTF